MKIKSKLRLDILLAATCLVCIAFIAPYLAYLKISERFDKNYLKEPSIFLLIIFVGLIFLGLVFYLFYEIVTKTLVITINDANKTILFNYPFQFKKKEYLFNQVVGFRFSSFYTRICDFKTLLLKTADNSLYTIPEFQIANFTKFEAFAIENFNLKKGIDFISLTTEGKIEELKENLTFNIEQARSYRATCYFHIGLIVILLLMNGYLAVPDRKFGWTAISFLGGYLIFLLLKINQANKTIKNFS
ncbi:MAG: hypothetical protein ABJB11_24090 [Ferruginibacter sp.]